MYNISVSKNKGPEEVDILLFTEIRFTKCNKKQRQVIPAINRMSL